MQAVLDDALAAGGFGFSTANAATQVDGDGRPTPPNFATRDEFVALASACRAFPGTSLEFIPGTAVQGFTEDRRDVKLLADTIGVDKILFGSDWPHGEGLADPMTFTADIPQFPEFSAEDTRKVMRDNALELLGANVRTSA